MKQPASERPKEGSGHRTAADWVSELGPVVFGVIAVIGCTLWLLHASHESARTSGTVTSSHGRSCSITYRDATGTSHTYRDEGGRTGCSVRVGQRVDVYYEPVSPEDAALSSSHVQMIAAAVGIASNTAGGGILYTSSKHALHGAIRQLAYELAPTVRVNGVAPGVAATQMRGISALGQSAGDAVIDGTREVLPLRQIPDFDAYAAMYTLLASSESAAMTGSIVTIDSGLGVRGIARPGGRVGRD